MPSKLSSQRLWPHHVKKKSWRDSGVCVGLIKENMYVCVCAYKRVCGRGRSSTDKSDSLFTSLILK